MKSLERLIRFVKKRPYSLIGYIASVGALGLAIQQGIKEPEDFLIYSAASAVIFMNSLFTSKREKIEYKNVGTGIPSLEEYE